MLIPCGTYIWQLPSTSLHRLPIELKSVENSSIVRRQCPAAEDGPADIQPPYYLLE